MLCRITVTAILVVCPTVGLAQDAADPASTSTDELVLLPDEIISVKVNGVPIRFIVTAGAFGPAMVNPAVAVHFKWRAAELGHYDLGGNDLLVFGVLSRTVEIGGKEQKMLVRWSTQPASDIADGVIGVHLLPYKRVTFKLGAPVGEQTVQRFPLTRFGPRLNENVGTELDADGKKFNVVFDHLLTDNLVTAPTANFLASRFGGRFIPGSGSQVALGFDVQRPTRMMKLTRPLKLGDMLIDRFAVRYQDYGNTNKIAESESDDPHFDPNEIIVLDSKRRGRPDFLTGIGWNQIAHCSQITYDFELREIRLICGPN